MANVHPIPTDPRFQDLTGMRFSRIVVKCYAGKQRRAHYWHCVCDCGTETRAQAANLKSGSVQSCGCLARDANTTHGKAKTDEYRIWSLMIDRCTNSGTKNWKRYGGRGITVCERWLESFENFLADMGPRPSPQHSIERIKNDEGYSVDNCHWATSSEQARNRRSNRLLTLNGKTQCAAEWAEELCIPAQRICDRKYRGWSDADALRVAVFINQSDSGWKREEF